jgi:ParB family chromosome partitioning protein
VARHSGLGRAREPLIPVETGPGRTSALRDVPVTSVSPTPTNLGGTSTRSPRQSGRLDSGAGALQPILVRPVGDEEYELIAGERRWRAARRAGLQTVPALVQEADDKTSLERSG